MSERPRTRVVIAGGGTAGWTAAAALSRKLGPLLDITLVESEQIGTVGVGEATIPPMRVFHKLLGIDEAAFMRATQATFKLGIAFEDWGRIGERYIHSFGRAGQSGWLTEFHSFWLEGVARGLDVPLGAFCLELQAAEAGRFATAPDSDINFAYHLDAGLYARFLREFSERHGVRRVEGRIESVRQQGESGDIEALQLDGARTIEGDFFIDCTGFRGLLIEQTLQAGYDDWRAYLPCDSAVAVQTETVAAPRPYTRSMARQAGWQWQIPLQHRVGNGLVYCSEYQTDDAARDALLSQLEGRPLIEPRLLRFTGGRRRVAWKRNCVALGLASGFIEPLESTSIHLFMVGVTRLMQHFPFDGVSPAYVARFNELTRIEMEKVRDFIVLHYHATQREDTPFWRHCRQMPIPDSLAQRIALFRDEGYAYQEDGELFRVDSWTQVMLGQGIRPRRHHRLPALMRDEEMRAMFAQLSGGIRETVSRMPTHQAFIDRYCKAGPPTEVILPG